MRTISLYLRNTYTYRDGYRYLDDFSYVGTVKLAGPTVISRGKSFDEGDTVRYTTRLPSGLDPKVAAKAIRDTIGGSNCRHDYDCCGCASRAVFTRLIRPRRLSVIVKTSYNY